MGRVYYAQFNNVAVTAAQDLFEILPAGEKPVKLLSCIVSVYDSETNEQFTCTVQRRISTPTSGSGGSAPTIYRVNTHDAAASALVEANNTARASGGTQQILHAEGWPSQGGWGFTPLPGTEPIAVSGELLAIGLENNPSASVAMNGSIVFEEMA